MSGNRKQNQAKPDCGDLAKAKSNIHRETAVTAPVLDSTRDFEPDRPILVYVMAEVLVLLYSPNTYELQHSKH
jgi:hypothetical protein